MSRPIVWFEVLGTDLARTQGFYGHLFGWRYQHPSGMPDYGLVEGQGPDAGTLPGGVGSGPAPWTTFYVSVDDLDATIAQANELGASVLLPPRQTPDGGRIAVVSDPDGQPVGLIQTAA